MGTQEEQIHDLQRRVKRLEDRLELELKRNMIQQLRRLNIPLTNEFMKEWDFSIPLEPLT